MSAGRFAEAWEGYARLIPHDAHPVQVQETRRAFYSGATALFALVISQLEPGSEATDNDLRLLDELQAEFEAFTRDVGEGRA